MSRAETYRKNQILLENDGQTSYICRINAGSGWTASRKDIKFNNVAGALHVILNRARKFIGAPPGWPDLCG